MTATTPGGEAHDRDLLAQLGKKQQVVRDHTAAVAKGYKTGFFLHGHGGVGKSYTVLRHLEELDAPHQLYNSRMTAKGCSSPWPAPPTR